jgi:hypothetical protein
MWRQLRAENAPLRIVRNDRLQSASLDHFDELVLACASDQWLGVEQVVGRALVEAWDEDGVQTGDLVLAARVRALIEAGRLEARGEAPDWRRGEVRLPAQQPA